MFHDLMPKNRTQCRTTIPSFWKASVQGSESILRTIAAFFLMFSCSPKNSPNSCNTYFPITRGLGAGGFHLLRPKKILKGSSCLIFEFNFLFNISNIKNQ